MPAQFLNELILVIIAAFFGGFIARSLKLPPVLGYICSGILFGILGKNIFHQYSALLSLSQLGVSLLLFTLGFEVSQDVFKKINKRILLVGVLQIFVTTLTFFPIFVILKFQPNVSLLLAILCSFSSTAVVIKILEEKGYLNNFPGTSVFAILLIQDIFVVPVIFLLPLLFSKTEFVPASIFGFFVSALKPLVIFLALFLMSRIFLSRFLAQLFKYPSHELTLLATIFIAASSIWLLKSVGLPESIAAFLAGILISEEGKTLAPLSEIRPLRDILLVLFFVMTGMLVNVSYLWPHLITILSLSFIIIVGKFLVVFLVLLWVGNLVSSSIFIASHLANIGEFAVVIGQLAFLSGYVKEDTYNTLLSLFLLTLVSIPFASKYSKALHFAIRRFKPLMKVLGNYQDVVQALPTELANHVIICGHGRVGGEVRKLLELAQIPYIVIDFDKGIISKLLERGKPALYADPTDTQVLAASFINKAKVLVVAVPDLFSQRIIIKTALAINPQLLVVCRSHIEDDTIDLANLGVNRIVVPEFEAGLKIGQEVLEAFGVSKEKITLFHKEARK